MSAEDKKPATELAPVKAAAEAAADTALQTATEGVLHLYTPITGGGKEITALPYNFMTLTGWEIARALDGDKSAGNAFRLSNTQALLLFAAAAAKHTPELDAIDIKERMKGPDGLSAIKLAELFYHASALRSGQTS